MPRWSGRGIEFTWIETRMSPPASARPARCALAERERLVPVARHHDPEEAAPELRGDAPGDVERDVLLGEAVGGERARVRPAVPGVEDDRPHVEVEERRVDRPRRGPGDVLDARARPETPATVLCGTTTTSGEEAPPPEKALIEAKSASGTATRADGAYRAPHPAPLAANGRRGAALDHLQVLPDGVAQHLPLQAIDLSHAQLLILAAFTSRVGPPRRAGQGTTRTARTGDPSPPSIRRGSATSS